MQTRRDDASQLVDEITLVDSPKIFLLQLLKHAAQLEEPLTPKFFHRNHDVFCCRVLLDIVNKSQDLNEFYHYLQTCKIKYVSHSFLFKTLNLFFSRYPELLINIAESPIVQEINLSYKEIELIRAGEIQQVKRTAFENIKAIIDYDDLPQQSAQADAEEVKIKDLAKITFVNLNLLAELNKLSQAEIDSIHKTFWSKVFNNKIPMLLEEDGSDEAWEKLCSYNGFQFSIVDNSDYALKFLTNTLIKCSAEVQKQVLNFLVPEEINVEPNYLEFRIGDIGNYDKYLEILTFIPENEVNKVCQSLVYRLHINTGMHYFSWNFIHHFLNNPHEKTLLKLIEFAKPYIESDRHTDLMLVVGKLLAKAPLDYLKNNFHYVEECITTFLKFKKFYQRAHVAYDYERTAENALMDLLAPLQKLKKEKLIQKILHSLYDPKKIHVDALMELPRAFSYLDDKHQRTLIKKLLKKGFKNDCHDHYLGTYLCELLPLTSKHNQQLIVDYMEKDTVPSWALAVFLPYATEKFKNELLTHILQKDIFADCAQGLGLLNIYISSSISTAAQIERILNATEAKLENELNISKAAETARLLNADESDCVISETENVLYPNALILSAAAFKKVAEFFPQRAIDTMHLYVWDASTLAHMYLSQPDTLQIKLLTRLVQLSEPVKLQTFLIEFVKKVFELGKSTDKPKLTYRLINMHDIIPGGPQKINLLAVTHELLKADSRLNKEDFVKSNKLTIN